MALRPGVRCVQTDAPDVRFAAFGIVWEPRCRAEEKSR